MNINNFVKRCITSFLLLILLAFMFYSNFVLTATLILFCILAWFEIRQLSLKIFKKKIYLLFFNTFFLVYFFIFFIFIYYVLIEENFIQEYRLYIFYSILISIFSDIGGYIIGNIFKGKKLTKISPNKTISGSIGSFFFPICLIPFFIGEFQNISLNYLVISTFVISFISQAGDLFFSYLKRLAKIKDISNILPGHGGIIDRTDGIIFSIPSGFFILNLY